MLQDFIQLYFSLYSISRTKFLCNQCLSTEFDVCAWVRQGDPYSPWLLNLHQEIFSRIVLKHDLYCPQLQQESVPMILYADNSLIPILNLQDLEGLTSALATFKERGIVDNSNKMQILEGGPRNPGEILIFRVSGHLVKPSHTLLYLGIEFEVLATGKQSFYTLHALKNIQKFGSL